MQLGFTAQLGVAASGKARCSRKPPLYVVPNLNILYADPSHPTSAAVLPPPPEESHFRFADNDGDNPNGP